MSQFPVPRPQATVVDTYAPAALVQPTAPVQYAPGYAQGLMPGTEMSQALRRLSGALSQYGPSLVASEAEKAKELEDIRLARMTTDEIRADLMSQAKAMEQNGTLSAGSNPYRLMAIQENLATRVMRDEFEATLAANLNKFSSPDNSEDAAEFALETFQSIQLPGYFGKAKAAQMYQAATDKWLNQVQQQRNVRMAARNREDLSDTAYASLNRMYSDPTIGLDTTAAELSQAMDEFYALTGESGRDQVVTAISTLIANKGKAAARAGDEEEIDRLQVMLDRIRDAGGKALQFGSSYESEFDALETALDEFRESAKNKERTDDEDVARDISSKVFIKHAESGTLSAAFDSDMVADMVAEMELGGVSQGTISRILEGLPTRVRQYRSATLYDPEVESDLGSKALRLSPEEFQIELAAALGSGQVSAETAMRLQVMASQANAQKDANRAAAGVAGGDTLATANAMGRTIANDMVETMGLDMGIAVVDQELQTILQDVGADVAKVTPIDHPDRDKLIRNAMQDRIKLLQKIQTRDENGLSFFDLDVAKEYGFSVEAIDAMRRYNRLNAESTVRRPSTDLLVPEEEEVTLVGGTWYTTDVDYFGYVDDIGGADLGQDLTSVITKGNKIRSAAAAAKSNYRETQFTVFRGVQDVPVQVRADGLYVKWLGADAYVKMDVSNQDEYAQAVRLAGLTVAELEQGKTTEGLMLSSRPEFWDPGKTVMSNPATFVSDIQAIAEANEYGMTQEGLLEAVKDTNIAQAYLAYVKGRGPKAVGFDLFVTGQIDIMAYAGAPTPATVIVQFRNSGKQPLTPEAAPQPVPIDQESN